MKKYFKYLFTLVFLFLLSYRGISVVYAETIDCKPEELIYQKSINIFDLDIRRTVDNFITSTLISLFANIAGLNPDKVMGCQSYIYRELETALTGNNSLHDELIKLEGDMTECDTTGPDVCAELVGNIGSGNGNYTSSDNVEIMAVRSSLLGFNNMVEGAARNEPLPVNLAYYWNRSIEDLPYVNKALAAPNDAYENLPMIKAAYGLWTLSSRVALGLMSVVLLYTGMMIILRKKVNTQLVVSVQYAIPKLVMSIFLIIFSYPIGAVITSVSWGIFRGAFPLVFNTLLGRDMGANFPSGILFLSLILMVLRLAQGGYFYVLLVIIVAIVLLVLNIIINFKALLIYLKMVLSIITAPLEFAIGAIPGSEARVMDWFKRMAKYAVTIIAMGVVIPLTLVFSLSVMLAYATGQSGEVGGWGVVIALLAPLLIVIFGFGIGINMEKHVDGFFGEKKRK